MAFLDIRLGGNQQHTVVLLWFYTWATPFVSSMVLLKSFEDHSGFLCYETTASNPFRSISGLYSEMEDLKKSWRFSTCIRVKAITRTVGSVPFVPFGARHVHGVLERQLGNVYGSNSRSKQVLVHRRAWAESRNKKGLRSGQCTCEAGLHFACNKDEHTISYNMIQYVLCTYKL